MYFICYGSVGISHDQNTENLFTQVDPILLRRGAAFGELALMMHCRRKARVKIYMQFFYQNFYFELKNFQLCGRLLYVVWKNLNLW